MKPSFGLDPESGGFLLDTGLAVATEGVIRGDMTRLGASQKWKIKHAGGKPVRLKPEKLGLKRQTLILTTIRGLHLKPS